uniref:Serine/threonine-protein kinase receptor n=1 Tax=Vespula pensylvanica TaxID=30213 RepID=A0A834P1H1_VESPE|nr:hypothetical protein H0235_007541 [Vespula pensylvanica]
MRAIVSVVLVTLLYGISSAPIYASRICASRKKNNEYNSLKQNSAGVPEDVPNNSNVVRISADDDIKFEICNNFCHALWQENKTANGTEIIILSQGCWKQSGEQKCENTECMALQRSTKALNNTKFCCCHGDYCNLNITNNNLLYSDNKIFNSAPVQKNLATTEYLEQSDSERWLLIILSTLVCILLVICTIAMMIYRTYRNNILARLGKPMSYNDQFMDSTALRTGTYTVDHLKLTTIVGQGRYGSVWQGSMGDQDVAVKIFPSHYRNYFQNERDTYCLPFMEHPSLLSYYGVDERISMEGSTEYLLVLSFAPGGTLTDFLQAHTVDWMTFCKMGLSIVKGLAYLHTDIRKGGLAVQISGSKYYSNGEEQHAEIKSINDVGTLRYMAPEVLEGAVNLRDCESSLKQIDVYAMGLVLWELVSRCSDIYIPGSEVPQYKQPYENEIGLHPTFEQMQVLVSRKKARPLLEGNLIDRPGVRLIKETMEDCWDADAEARLTALCIEERLSELQSHRITSYFTDGSPMVNSHCALVPSTTNSLYSETSHHDNIHVVQLAMHMSQDGSTNESNMVDNLVTLSPSDSVAHEHSFKNSNEVAVYNHTQTLQPYQGRNPCMERNLMLQSDSLEDLGCNGNVLVDKSLKHTCNDQYKVVTEAQGLVSHDYLGQHTTQLAQLRPATPIPYVQNVISEDGATSYNKRKQTNVHDNFLQESPRKKIFGGWPNLKKLLVNKKMHPYNKYPIDREDSKSNLLSKQNVQIKTVDTNVTISSGGKYVNGIIGKTSTSTAPIVKNDKNVVQTGKHAYDNDGTTNARPSTLPLVNLKNKKGESNLSRQESIDKFNEVFNVRSNVNVLKDPHMRIKTPGDLPPSVRKIRGRAQSTARFSLYDDRMMCNILSEEDDRSDKAIWNSVPFGMDLGEGDGTSSPIKHSTKNVTCF